MQYLEPSMCLLIAHHPVGGWSVKAVVFGSERLRLRVPVQGIIGNSVPTSASGKARLVDWKRRVAAVAMEARGPSPLEPSRTYSVTAGFSFHLPSHRNQNHLEV
jgi:hypothetical protein